MDQMIFQIHDDVEMRHWWFRARRKILRDLIRLVLPDAAEAVVVDVGCGTGGNLAELADEYRCIGIDPSAEAIGLARRRHRRVNFLKGTAPDGLGALATRADMFLLNDVLEHVEDDRALLAALVDAASPRTWFLITVPADPALWGRHDEIHAHYRRYTQQRLEEAWDGLPVEPLLVSHFNARLYPAIRAARGMQRVWGTSLGPHETDLALPPRWANGWLERIFAGESRVLCDLLLGKRSRGYSRGVSLIALLRKTAAPAVALPQRARKAA